MNNKTDLEDKTKLFLGLQEEARAGQTNSSTDIRIHLDQAATDLCGYFENPDFIPSALGTGGLRYEHSFLQHNRLKPWIDQTLHTMLAEFRAARTVNASLCFQTWGGWAEAIDRAIRNAAAVACLQEDIEKLGPEFMTKSIMRNVGDTLEGSFQPMARLRLDMQGVAGKRAKGSQPTASMSFGKVIEELTSRPTGGSIYRPQPFGVTVSQWRNIANHNCYVVNGNEVTCTYGKPGNLQSIHCPVTDIIDLGMYMNDLSFVHKIAYEIFSIDNMKELTPYTPNIELTDYTKDTALAYGLVAVGFTIEKVGYKPGKWALLLIDDCERNEHEAKSALQNAIVTYVILSSSVEVFALIKSGTSAYRFSFNIRVGSKSENLAGVDGEVKPLDKYCRPILLDEPLKDSED